jgi:putative hydrolase of the HAD superfamily
MIETIISDLGQVLLDFDNGIFFRKMTRFTRKSLEEIRAVTRDNNDLLTLFDKGAISPYDFYANARDLLQAEVSYEDFYASYCDIFTLRTEVLALYRRLRAKYRMVLLSNTDVMRWTFVKGRFPEILFFDAYVLSFDAGFMKPQLEIYLEALRLSGTRPERAVFIDDVAENVAGANRAGLAGVVLGPGTDLEAALRAVGVAA